MSNRIVPDLEWMFWISFFAVCDITQEDRQSEINEIKSKLMLNPDIFTNDNNNPIQYSTNWCKIIEWMRGYDADRRDLKIAEFMRACYLEKDGLDLSDFFHFSRSYTDAYSAIATFAKTWAKCQRILGKKTHLLTIPRVIAVLMIGQIFLIHDETGRLEQAYAVNKETWPQYIIPIEQPKAMSSLWKSCRDLLQKAVA
ncbi:MAG: hypothetical protein GY793_10940 [Proteobacteria bacterium]|nr:hypothetical protein [Pseudomonadota bacterium]